MKIHSTTKSGRTVLTDRIRLARRRANLSQTALAALTNVTPSAVAQWESPRGTQPGIDHLARIAEATRVSLDWLVAARPSAPAGKHPGAEGDPSAVMLDAFAQTPLEESLLVVFRKLSPRVREMMVALVEELVEASANIRARTKRR